MARNMIRFLLAALLLASGPAWGQANRVGPLQAQNNLSDVSSVSTVRTNLGLGTAALKAASGSGATVASVTGSFTVGHIATFADTSGTVQDGGTAAGGTITGVTAGTGLTGGGTSGTVTVNLATPVAVANGGTGISSYSADQVLVATASTTLAATGVPNCTDTSGNHLNYATSTHTFSCGTSTSGGGGGGAPSRQTNTSSVGNGADTTEDDLQTITLTGGTMSAGGYLRIIAAGNFTGSTDAKVAKLVVGAQTLCTVSASTLTVNQWQIEAAFVMTGTSTNVTSARCWSGAANSSLTNAQSGPAPTTNLGITLSSNVTIKTTGRNQTNSTANSITSGILIVEYFP